MIVWLLACGDKVADTATETMAMVCEEPQSISCEDAAILDLALHDDKVSDGAVTSTADGADFVSTIDASAGGYNQAQNNAWVYVKFTSTGLKKVEIDDETALGSMDWDLSFRRFIIRLNGGSTGPSCVGSASFLEQSYAGLTSVPEGLSYLHDDFYTDDCTIINDSSGLPGSPQVALAPWWSYDGCVQTTMVPHLLQLADGHIVKMVVESYYASGQDACNNGTGSGDSAANFTIRWTYMD
jgi:hypothetical protein